MSDGMKEISLDRYWARVATPYFLSVLGFSMFVLFQLKGASLASNEQVANSVKGISNNARSR
jgi:hypothetical protein